MNIKRLLFSVATFPILLTGCSLKTNVQGEFLLENNFKLVKEIENEIECPDEDKWFNFATTKIHLSSDEFFSMKLNYLDGNTKEIEGTYKLYVTSVGHSGAGYFEFLDETVSLEFQKSYNLVFDLPTALNPSQEKSIRTLIFQRW